jgi:hypothetical protein
MQCGEQLAWSFQDFGNRINQAFVIARLMSFDARLDWRYDVLRSAMLRKKDFDACASGLGRLDEDESVFVRQDHEATAGAQVLYRMDRQLADANRFRQAPETKPPDDFFSKALLVCSHS